MDAVREPPRPINSEPMGGGGGGNSLVMGPANSYGSSGGGSSGVQGSNSMGIPPSSASSMIQGMRLSFNHMPQSQPVSMPKPMEPPVNPVSMYQADGGDEAGRMFSMSEAARKKKARQRKYGPDSSMALVLYPDSSSPMTDPTAKRRGRPPGSGKKQQLEALGSSGVSFTPHVITVKSGEDVASKIMAFSQQGPRTVCILSANGAISNVTLRQPATSGGTVTYEGRFEIISLSGSYLLTENNGTRSRTGGLSVALAGSDGRVVGGGVAGMLMAATPVQVVMASFIAEGKKPTKPEVAKPEASSVPPQQVAAGFGMGPVASPPLHGTSSESSEDMGSPLNHSCGISNNSQHIPGIAPPYTSLGWPHTISQHRHDMV